MVELPNNPGPIQSLIRLITNQINNLSKSVVSKVKNLGSKYKPPKFKIKINSPISDVKYEPVSEYIKKEYPLGYVAANNSAELTGTIDCNVAMEKLQKKLDDLVKKFETDSSNADSMLKDINEFFNQVKPILDIMQDLLTLGISIDTVVKAVNWIIQVLGFVLTYTIKPTILMVDKLYETYRFLKVGAALGVIEIKDLYEIKCVLDCKYKGNQSNCPILKKMGTKSCPLLDVSNRVVPIGANLTTVVDIATLPIDEVLRITNQILSIAPVNKFIKREYPNISIDEVTKALKKLSEESGMNQDGVVPSPDVDKEMKVSIEKS